jgi:hypothetical protein
VGVLVFFAMDVLVFFAGGGIEATNASAREVGTEVETRGVPKLCPAAVFRSATLIVNDAEVSASAMLSEYGRGVWD